MNEQSPRKRKSPTSPLDYDDASEGEDHPNFSTSLSSPSPTSILPLLPEFPPSAATPTDQISSHESSDIKNDSIDQNISLSSTSEPPPLPSSPSSSTLSLLPEIPPQPPSATPTDQLSLHESSDIKNDSIDQNTSLSSSTSEPPPLPPSSSTLPLLPETLPPPPSVTPTTDQPSSHESSEPKNEDDTIDPPYPWATNRRATVHSLDYLNKNGIKKIEGEVECKRCNNKYKRVFDLEGEFKKIADFMIIINKDSSRERVLQKWLTPDLGGCDFCGEDKRLKPFIPEIESGQEVNWLFLFLGQMLGFCGVDQLKYFCKHTKVRCLGAKERLVHVVYLGLCKQLNPTSAAFDP